MSLLEAIAQRHGEKQTGMQQAQQAQQEEAGKPDANQQISGQREAYSGAMSSAPDQEMQEEAPTAEEQALFTEMERAMAEVVYGEKASGDIIKAVMGAGDPVEGVGKISADIVSSLSQKFPNASDEVLMGIGESAVEQVVDLVEGASPDLNMSDDQISEAYSIGVSAWMEKNPDSVDKDMGQYLNEPAPAQI